MKQLGDNSAEQMKQLVSVLAVQDPKVPTAASYQMSEPVTYVNSAQFPGNVADHTQAAAASQGVLRSTTSLPPASFASNQGRGPVQCWNCGGGHYRSGCPLLPRPFRQIRDAGDLAQGFNSHGDRSLAASYGRANTSYGRKEAMMSKEVDMRGKEEDMQQASITEIMGIKDGRAIPAEEVSGSGSKTRPGVMPKGHIAHPPRSIGG